MNKYIDLKKLEYNDDIIEVDSEIADTILELNKKGYITKACCSGHSKIEFYPYEKELDKKEELLKSGNLIYDESDKLYCVLPSITTTIYILFSKKYNFDKIPNGFTYNIENQTISKTINLYDFSKNTYIRPNDGIISDLKKSNEELLNWAKKLPNIK